MADQVEKAERAMSTLMRLGISAVFPVWAILLIFVGFEHRSPWWIGTGAVVGALGLLFLAGSPIANLISREK